MCDACGPEPVDEQSPVAAETRGGNQLADITVPPLLPVPDPATVTVTDDEEE